MREHPLTETAVLVHLYLRCKPIKGPIQLAMGRIRNHFYASTLSWLEASQGRVIPIKLFPRYHDEYDQLRDDFYRAVKNSEVDTDLYEVALVVLPVPTVSEFISTAPELEEFVLESLDGVSETVTSELEGRFVRRITMLQQALLKGKRFNSSLLDELDKVVEMGTYLEKTISLNLRRRLHKADTEILTYPAEEIRQSTSLREELIRTCGGLL